MSDCGFCKGGHVGNANRWHGSTQGPATLPCPRCGIRRCPCGWEFADGESGECPACALGIQIAEPALEGKDQ